MKRMLSLILAFCMFFSLTVSAEGRFNQLEINSELKEYLKELPLNESKKIQERINEPLLTNLNELSIENKEIVIENIKNPKNLAWAFVYEEKPVIIYTTIEDDVYISITDGYVEVISYKKNNIMTVNDVDIAYELKVTESTSLGKVSEDEFVYSPKSVSYVNISDPGGTWSYVTTRTVDNTWAILLINVGIGAMTTFIMMTFGTELSPNYNYAAGIAACLLSHSLAEQVKSARFIQVKDQHDTLFKTYKFSERALAKGLDDKYYETGPWEYRYIAWAGL